MRTFSYELSPATEAGFATKIIHSYHCFVSVLETADSHSIEISFQLTYSEDFAQAF